MRSRGGQIDMERAKLRYADGAFRRGNQPIAHDGAPWEDVRVQPIQLFEACARQVIECENGTCLILTACRIADI